MNKKCLLDYGNKLNDSLKTIDESLVHELKDEISKRMNGESEIFLLGNGGSAANAHHISGDYLKTFTMIGKCLKITCLSDNGCFITAAANDLDYSEVYEVLINSRVKKNDLVIFLSGSGNSMNLVKSARAAKNTGMKTAAIVGYSGGALSELVDIPIHVSVKDMEIAEDCQMIIFHFLKQCLFDEVSIGDKEIMPKYTKRTSEGLIA
ncbi:SIS domain-containing protein [Prochlorococcus sp. AH-716-P05]|nr:SIS domain-containing protein [Prochlorococcus sp. AH-716-P05]